MEDMVMEGRQGTPLHHRLLKPPRFEVEVG